MDGKINYAEVLIDGKVYTVGGAEDVGYFQKIAAYINLKLGELRSQRGFSKQNEDYQQLMLAINMADDYFKAQDTADLLKRQKEETERDIYSIKHDLIDTQIKLEEAQGRIQELEAALLARSVSAEKQTKQVENSLADSETEGEEAVQEKIEEKEASDLEETKRLAKVEEEKQKALEAAKLATEQLLKSRPVQNRGRQTKR